MANLIVDNLIIGGKIMTVEKMKSLVARIPNEALNGRRLEVIDEVFSPRFVNHVDTHIFGTGLEGFKQALKGLLSAFPDIKYTIEKTICEGDTIVHFVSVRGTQKGEFMGISATGKQATWTEVHIARLENDKLVEHWGVLDKLALLQQIGVIPADLGGELA